MPKKPAVSGPPQEIVINLEASLAARRRRAPAAWETDQGVHKRRFTSALDDCVQTATQLGQDVSSLLSERIDELSTHHHEFKVGMTRLFLRVLRIARDRAEQVVLFNEAVPGFTLMLFKKAPEQWGAIAGGPERAPAQEDASGPELAAAGHVIAQFAQRTGERVLTVENDDALFVFFPTSDIKKNLKELGFYYTDSFPTRG